MTLHTQHEKPHSKVDDGYDHEGLADPDGFLRKTFTLPVDDARAKAREFLREFPSAGYMRIVERWRQLPDGQIEFTMRRLPTAD